MNKTPAGFVLLLLSAAVVAQQGGRDAPGGASPLPVAPYAYPESEARAGHSGVVQVSVKIQLDGTTADVRIVEGSGWPALDEAALNVAKGLRLTKMQIESLKLNRAAVDQPQIIPLAFKREQSSRVSTEEFGRLGRLLARFYADKQFTTVFLTECGRAGHAIGDSLSRITQDNAGPREVAGEIEKQMREIYVALGSSTFGRSFEEILRSVETAADRQANDFVSRLDANAKKQRCSSQVSLIKAGQGSFEYSPDYYAFLNWRFVVL